MRLVGINLFPVKSASGLPLAAAEIGPRGLHGDRRWMLVDPAGRHVTQREIPALALLEVTPIPAGLILAYGGAAIEVAAPLRDSPREPVSVWGDARSPGGSAGAGMAGPKIRAA